MSHQLAGADLADMYSIVHLVAVIAYIPHTFPLSYRSAIYVPLFRFRRLFRERYSTREGEGRCK